VPSEFRITVYDKNGDFEGGLPLPNVGYEAHTYLTHIITRYDSLSDLTVFAQGRPFDHVPDFHKKLRRLAKGDERVEEFKWLGFVVDYDDPKGHRVFRSWSKNRDGRELNLCGFFRSLWDCSAPERIVFYPGAQFIASKELILKQPLSFYERALALSTEFADAGHCFERTWDRVLGCDGLPEALKERELPIYLRPIRRLGTTWDSVPEAERGW
jgi:hypothetical protein